MIVHENIIRGRFLVEVDGRLLLQFKKLTRDLVTVNNPTETSEAFDRQQEIEGVPALPRLTVGYQLGQYRTDLAGIYLAFLIGKECIWHHDLRTGEGSIGMDLEFPTPLGPSPAEREAVEAEHLAKQKNIDSNKKDAG